MGKKRKKLPKRKSRKLFRKTAGTHKRNLSPAPMRGGFRI